MFSSFKWLNFRSDFKERTVDTSALKAMQIFSSRTESLTIPIKTHRDPQAVQVPEASKTHKVLLLYMSKYLSYNRAEQPRETASYAYLHEILNNLLEIYSDCWITVRHQSVCFLSKDTVSMYMCKVLKCMEYSKWYKCLINCLAYLKKGRFLCVCAF